MKIVFGLWWGIKRCSEIVDLNSWSSPIVRSGLALEGSSGSGKVEFRDIIQISKSIFV